MAQGADTQGCLVCVVGPSGAGKDTLIALARASLAGEPRVLFPRRLVTRMSSRWEEHDTLSRAEFDAGVRGGRFALHWEAHGLGYALPGSVATSLAAGTTIVCNVSRTSLEAARQRFANVRVVLVTAPPAVIAERLAARGRDAGGKGAGSVAGRMARAAMPDSAFVADAVIENVGAPDAGAALLIRQIGIWAEDRAIVD